MWKHPKVSYCSVHSDKCNSCFVLHSKMYRDVMWQSSYMSLSNFTAQISQLSNVIGQFWLIID